MELFIEDLETKQVDLMYFNKPSDAGKDVKDRSNPKDILNLFPIRGDVDIKKGVQVGTQPQVDQPFPSPKVEQNDKGFDKSQ